MTSTIDFVMPSLGADMDEGTIIEWMIAAGDPVARGDVVAVVETDKADIDIEVWHDGVVADILVPPGELVPVGTALARLDVTDDAAPCAVAPPVRTAPEVETTEPVVDVDRDVARPAPVVDLPIADTVVHQEKYHGVRQRIPPTDGGVGASPLARRLAAEQGLDLTTLVGSGPGGAIIARDLTAVDRSPAEATKPDTSPAERMRAAIAELMARSKREIPHYYLAADIDVEPALRWLESVNAERSMQHRILPAAVLMKAVAAALADHPELNGFWLDDGFEPGRGVHLGVAVSLRSGGLVAPAIHDADRLGVPELMEALRDVVGRARAGRLRGSEMTDPTITVTNLGDRGVDVVHGVIYPPQVALVGLGRIAGRPAVVDGVVVARRQVTITLAADHRASDGQRGARLLNTIDRLLQEPEQL